MAFQLVGLDGVERSSEEVFAGLGETLSHGHGLRTQSGYIVRRTFFEGERAHEDVAAFGATHYSAALARAYAVRVEKGHHGYAVVDRLYSCGCRGMG